MKGSGHGGAGGTRSVAHAHAHRSVFARRAAARRRLCVRPMGRGATTAGDWLGRGSCPRRAMTCVAASSRPPRWDWPAQLAALEASPSIGGRVRGLSTRAIGQWCVDGAREARDWLGNERRGGISGRAHHDRRRLERVCVRGAAEECRVSGVDRRPSSTVDDAGPRARVSAKQLTRSLTDARRRMWKLGLGTCPLSSIIWALFGRLAARGRAESLACVSRSLISSYLALYFRVVRLARTPPQGGRGREARGADGSGASMARRARHGRSGAWGHLGVLTARG